MKLVISKFEADKSATLGNSKLVTLPLFACQNAWKLVTLPILSYDSTQVLNTPS